MGEAENWERDSKLFRQRPVFGFGQERKDGEAQEEYDTNPGTGGAETLDVATEPTGQLAEGEGRGGGNEAVDVVAETCPGAAQTRGKKFGEVDRVNGEDAQ